MVWSQKVAIYFGAWLKLIKIWCRQIKDPSVIQKTEKALGKIAGASDIRSKISRARRSLSGRNPDPRKSLRELQAGLSLYRSEINWRKRAADELLPGLIVYDDAIKNSIGLRQQERLTSEQAAEIAVCQSFHRDISLNF
mgnify:CR=1 FL=1